MFDIFNRIDIIYFAWLLFHKCLAYPLHHIFPIDPTTLATLACHLPDVAARRHKFWKWCPECDEDKQGSFEICACNAKDVPLRSSLSRSRYPRSLALSHAFAAWHLLFATFSRHPKKSWKYKYNTSAKVEYRQKLVRPLVTSEAGKNRQDVYQSAAAGESFGGRCRTRRLLGIPETHLPHLRLPHQPDDQYLRAPLWTQYRPANPGEIQVSGMDFSQLRAKKK